MRTIAASLFFTLLFPLLGFADQHARANAHQHRRIRSDVSRLLQPRGNRATFYDVGLGACGKTNVASDFVIALNVPQYANGAHCYQMVTITYQGKSTQAQVVDECEGCPYGAIDMSRGLFDFFASESLGEIQVDWSFGGGGDSAPSSSEKPKPKPSPTSTSSSSTSTWKPPKTSSSSSSWSSSSSSSSSWSSSSTSSNSVPTSTPSATPTAQASSGPNNLADLDSLVASLGQLVLSAGQ